MDILILGGTGAMGRPLVKELSWQEGNMIYVTSRSKYESVDQRTETGSKIEYIQGNAHDQNFIKTVLKDRYFDCIIDFMTYTTEEFKQRISLLLSRTDQYIFLSSARVYAETKGVITEQSPRLLDICLDEQFLKTDGYALAKAREEDLLYDRVERNWTIIRPYLTYNDHRLQLGVYEKEHWLQRVMEGKKLLFPRDMAEKKTTMTYALDVASAIRSLIGNEHTLGDVFQIASSESYTWKEIIRIYFDIINKYTGNMPDMIWIESADDYRDLWPTSLIHYDRLYDRQFDSRKLLSVIGYTGEKEYFRSLREGLEECLCSFFSDPQWKDVYADYEAWSDRHTGEHTSIWKIPGKRNKIKYIVGRYAYDLLFR